jgi:hypothetical protein
MLIYVAHPVSGDPIGNAARARRWLRWLLDSVPGVYFTAPWLAYLDVLDDTDPEHRRRGLRCSIANAARAEGIILVGGEVTNGMQAEREAVTASWFTDRETPRVFDATALGMEPPFQLMPDLLRQTVVWPPRAVEIARSA